MRYLIFIIIFSLLILAIIVIFDEDTAKDLQQENEVLTDEVNDLRLKVVAGGKQVLDAERKMRELERELEDMLNVANSSIRDPVWEELRRFVERDDTDTREYFLNEFDCEGFTITLRDNAYQYGFRCAYVSIGFEGGSIGHTLNAFQTTDYGLVYIDNTEEDMVGYLEKNRIYGTIILKAVKSTYINCDMNPDEFWNPITYAEFEGNIFDYRYYDDYTGRWAFYELSRSVCNDEISSYNEAVTGYSQGNEGYSKSELDAWGNRLETWAGNLDKLLADLGTLRTTEKDIVETIEIYWN